MIGNADEGAKAGQRRIRSALLQRKVPVWLLGHDILLLKVIGF